jgi:hypothetical protein
MPAVAKHALRAPIFTRNSDVSYTDLDGPTIYLGMNDGFANKDSSHLINERNNGLSTCINIFELPDHQGRSIFNACSPPQ